VLAVLCAAVTALGSSADTEWQAPQAPLRFTVALKRRPTHGRAGYFLRLPDGGILPRPFPLTRVVDRDGSPLKSATLWHSRAVGLGIVFEDPGHTGNVHVYVAGSRKLDVWSPDSGLTPSAILCTRSRHGSRRDAEALAGLGRADGLIHFLNRAGSPEAPLSVPGDLSGREAPCALYMLAYLATKDAGKTWIAPITFCGESEVRIDNQVITPKKRIEKSGGTGQWLELSQGLHRLDIRCWSDLWTSKQGLMALTWKTPNTTIGQLGGRRGAHLRFPGTAMWASRHLQTDEIVRSGHGTIHRIQSRDGGPVAHFSMRATHNFWFEGEDPVFVYELTAFTAGNPKESEYVWSFGDEAEARGGSLSWLFRGREEHTVKLTAVAAGRQSTRTVPFYPFTSSQTSMRDPAARSAYRAACLNVFRAYPPDADPTAAWDESMWSNFFRNMEIGRGDALLSHIFTQRWEKLKRKLPVDRRERLEDMFMVLASRVDPAKAAQWASGFAQGAASPVRAGYMRLAQAESLMYGLGKLGAAEEIIRPMTRHRSELAERAKIRLGDVKFLAGDLNAATKLYGDAQSRFRPLNRASAAAQRQEDTARAAGAAVGAGKIDDWKASTIKEVFASETVRSLLRQGYYGEARAALRDWERQFPLSKISGDYVLLEAKLYMAWRDNRRARAMLEAYCDHVDASSFIPDAVGAVLDCMLEMQETDAVLVKFCESVKKRIEFHPVAEHVNGILRSIERGEPRPGSRRE